MTPSLSTYITLTPYGRVDAVFGDGPGASMRGPDDAIAYVLSAMKGVTGHGGLTLTVDSVEELDYFNFCQPEGSNIRILPPAGVALDSSDDDDESADEDDDEDDGTNPEAEFEAAPDDEDDTVAVMDGDFKGHPFRGNQHRKASRESSGASYHSRAAKHVDETSGDGDDDEFQGSMHDTAHRAHADAAKGATGKTKAYHETMAEFHGKRRDYHQAKQGGRLKLLDKVEWPAEYPGGALILDGDFPGHPFRGNQYRKASKESGAAVSASIKAKRAETRGGDAKAQKSAHRGAHHAHMAAAEGATGKARSYHRKMAKFHGKRAGVVLDSAAMDRADPTLINKFSEGDKVICLDDDCDYTVTGQRGAMVSVKGSPKAIHANRLKLANGKKCERVALDAVDHDWHRRTQERFREYSDEQLRFVIKDAREAEELGRKMNPNNPRLGQYLDEISYASMELQRRKKGGKKGDKLDSAGLVLDETAAELNRTERVVARKLRQVADEVTALGTNGGARPLDARWAEGAIKRMLGGDLASVNLSGRQFGALASAKVLLKKDRVGVDQLLKAAALLEAADAKLDSAAEVPGLRAAFGQAGTTAARLTLARKIIEARASEGNITVSGIGRATAEALTLMQMAPTGGGARNAYAAARAIESAIRAQEFEGVDIRWEAATDTEAPTFDAVDNLFGDDEVGTQASHLRGDVAYKGRTFASIYVRGDGSAAVVPNDRMSGLAHWESKVDEVAESLGGWVDGEADADAIAEAVAGPRGSAPSDPGSLAGVLENSDGLKGGELPEPDDPGYAGDKDPAPTHGQRELAVIDALQDEGWKIHSLVASKDGEGERTIVEAEYEDYDASGPGITWQIVKTSDDDRTMTKALADNPDVDAKTMAELIIMEANALVMQAEQNDLQKLAALEAAVPKDDIRSDDPQLIPKLQAKLAALTARQEFMRKANKLIRAGNDTGLRNMGLPDSQIAALKQPDFAGRIGFPDYKLSNNNGVIAATRKRLEAAMKAASAGTETVQFRGADRGVEAMRVALASYQAMLSEAVAEYGTALRGKQRGDAQIMRAMREKIEARQGLINDAERALGLPLTVFEAQPSPEPFDHNGRLIYPTTVGGQARWAVQTDENKGTDRRMGDTLHPTREEAIKEADRMEASAAAAAERARLAAEEARLQAAAAANMADIDGFGDNMGALARGAAQAALWQRQRFNGQEMSRRDFIRQAVADGATVAQHAADVRRITFGGGGYMTQKDIGKTAMDYAEFLIAKKAGAAPRPDPVPPQPQPEPGPPVDPQRAADASLLEQIASGTHPDMLAPETADLIETVLLRYPGDAGIEALADKAVSAYSNGLMAATQ